MERRLNHWEKQTLNKFLFTLGKKRCSRCGKEKSLSEFGKHYNLGLFMNIHEYCRKCCSENTQKYQTEKISDSYIAGRLSSNLRELGYEVYSKDIPNEILNAYRKTLQEKRLIKSLKNQNDESKCNQPSPRNSGEISGVNHRGTPIEKRIAARSSRKSPSGKYGVKRHHISNSAQQREAER